ncbi:MAG TPA: hypothetical protein VK541_05040 [Pedobacter sp.]|uniref:hypothetical protein n=1 Tax=Pedobacter sp. TaxID=1411316 RepID=UPI002C75380E|nr:hypothetical protein [Pedobacter sp.]HMI01825.1 hypothetical protein [Pedobacter sp.]
MGTLQNVTLTGEILEDNDRFVKIKLTEDTISDLGKSDWRDGDEVCIGQELVESFI